MNALLKRLIRLTSAVGCALSGQVPAQMPPETQTPSRRVLIVVTRHADCSFIAPVWAMEQT